MNCVYSIIFLIKKYNRKRKKERSKKEKRKKKGDRKIKGNRRKKNKKLFIPLTNQTIK